MAAALMAPAGYADPLTDLRASLQSLRSATPVQGSLQVKTEDLLDADAAATRKAKSASLSLGVSADRGLRLEADPQLLQVLGDEEARHAQDPDQPQPTAELLKDIGPGKVQDLLDGADVLLRKLDGATSPQVLPAVSDGKAVTQLSVTRPYRPSKQDKGSVKDYQDTLTVTLDGHGTPLRYREITHGKFCMFFMCMTIDDQQQVSLQDLDHRLVAVDDVDELHQSGLGQEMHTRTEATFQISPASTH